MERRDVAFTAPAINAASKVAHVRSRMPGDLVDRWRADGDWPGTTLGELTRDLAGRDPDRVVIIDKDNHVTAAALFDEGARLASAMTRRGLKPGDVISCQLPNWYEASVINVAAALAGLVVNPLVPIYRDREIGFMLDDVGSRMVFVPRSFRGFDYAGMMLRVRDGLAAAPEIVVLRGDVDGCTGYADLLSSGSADDALPAVDPDSPFIVMHTSGTTGRPKCVVHSHNTLLAQLKFNIVPFNRCEREVYLVGTPISHIAGVIIGNLTIVGSHTTVVLMDIWNPEEVVQLIERHGVTMCGGATPFLAGILSAAQAAGTHLPTLTTFGCGGAGVPPELIIQASEWFPNLSTFRVFGATEAPTVTQGAPGREKLHHAAHTDGEILYSEIRMVDPVTGALAPPGEEGEILARGANVMLGYLREEDNADAFDADGFFRTGDLGRIIDGRYILITGRKKDLIIRNGENLSPKEIEDALFTHPAVENVAVVGMPSARTGEAVCAFIIPAPRASIDLAEVSRHLVSEGLAKQKIPERIVLVDALPISPQGKVLKTELRDRAREIARTEAV